MYQSIKLLIFLSLTQLAIGQKHSTININFNSDTSKLINQAQLINNNKTTISDQKTISDLRSRRSLNNEDNDRNERNPCSKTLFGEVAQKYPLRITDQISQRFEEFKCEISFSASGTKFGDRIELTFLSFQVGQLEYNSKEKSWTCPKGHLKLYEPTLSSTPSLIQQQKRGRKSSNESSSSLFSFQQRPSSSSLSNSLHPSSSSSSSSSSKQHSSSASFSGTAKDAGGGTFCGQMMSRKTVFYSRDRNVSMSVYLPPGRALFGHSVPFNLFLTYRFIPNEKMVPKKKTLRRKSILKTSSISGNGNDGRQVADADQVAEDDDDINFGVSINNTSCDKIFENCLKRKCLIQSPNYPGFYPGNLTCNYLITQYNNVPSGYKAHVIISQPNEYKISLPSPSVINSGYSQSNGPTSKSSTRLTNDCTSTDQIIIRDGADGNNTKQIVSTFCGSGHLAPIISSGPDMLITLKSEQFKGMYDNKFELEITIELIKMPINSMYRSSGICDEIYEGDLMRRGVIRSPRQTLPKDTNCFYQFLSNDPDDKIWIQFVTYFVQDLNQWSSEQSCDVSSLTIDGVVNPLTGDVTKKKNCSATSGVNNLNEMISISRRKDLISSNYKFCEKSSPKVCGRLNKLSTIDSKVTTPLPTSSQASPCNNLHESYLSVGPSLTISQNYFKNLDATSKFEAQFEFVSAKEVGDVIDGTTCDRLISSHLTKSGKIRSSRNVFLFGRGGTPRLRCEIKFNSSSDSGERVRIKLLNFHFNSSFCSTKRDAINENMFHCDEKMIPQEVEDEIITADENDGFDLIDYLKDKKSKNRINERKRSINRIGKLQIFEDANAKDAICICSGSKTRSTADSDEFLSFDLLAKDAKIIFEINGMTPGDDFNDFNFEASFEFIPASSASSSWASSWSCLASGTGSSFSGRSTDANVFNCFKLSSVHLLVITLLASIFIFCIIIMILITKSKSRLHRNAKTTISVTPTISRDHHVISNDDIDDIRMTFQNGNGSSSFGNNQQTLTSVTPMRSIHDYTTGITYKSQRLPNDHNYMDTNNSSSATLNANNYISTLSSRSSSASRRSSAGKSIIEHYQLPIYGDVPQERLISGNGFQTISALHRQNHHNLETFPGNVRNTHLPEVFTTRRSGNGPLSNGNSSRTLIDTSRTPINRGRQVASPYLCSSPTSTIVTNSSSGSSGGNNSYGVHQLINSRSINYSNQDCEDDDEVLGNGPQINHYHEPTSISNQRNIL